MIKKIKSIVFLIIFCYPFAITSGVFATVYEYSLNKKEALVIFEVEEEASTKKIRTFFKSPYASKLQKVPILMNVFMSTKGVFQLQREIVCNLEDGKTAINILPGGRRLEVYPHDPYTKILYFENGRIQNRLLLDPKLPVHDFSEILFLPARTRDNLRYHFYLLEGALPEQMCLEKKGEKKVLLKKDNKKIANILLGTNLVVKAIDFSVSEDPILNEYSLELRNIKDNGSEMGPKNIFLHPELFKTLLEQVDQRESNHQRSFDFREGSFRYLTFRRDSYDITEVVKDLAKNRLKSSYVIASNAGFRNVEIRCDERNRTFPISFNDQCYLLYERNHREIFKEKQEIRRLYNEVEFQSPIKWQLKGERHLVADFEYTYRYNVEGRKIYVVGAGLDQYFERKFGETPTYYLKSGIGDVISVIGVKRRIFWRDKKIGVVTLNKSNYWNQLSKELNARGKRISRKLNCVFDPSRRSVSLGFYLSEIRHGSKQVTFDLIRDFLKEYSVRPEHFRMFDTLKGVKLSGFLSDVWQRRITFNEVRDLVKDRLKRPYGCTQERWGIWGDQGKYELTVMYDLNLLLDKTIIKSVISNRYDIVEGPDCRLVDRSRIKCSFWGFKK